MSFIQTMVDVASNEIDYDTSDGLYHPLAGAIETHDGTLGSADGYVAAGLSWRDTLSGMASYQIDRLKSEMIGRDKYVIKDIKNKIQEIKDFVERAEKADLEAFKLALRNEYEKHLDRWTH